jgi:hypothetical protein
MRSQRRRERIRSGEGERALGDQEKSEPARFVVMGEVY